MELGTILLMLIAGLAGFVVGGAVGCHTCYKIKDNDKEA